MKRSQWFIVGIGLLIAVIAGVFLLGQANDATTPDNTVSQVSEPEGAFISPGLIQPAAYQQQFTSPGNDHFLVDVRTPEEFAAGHIEGAVNIPVQVLDQYISELPSDQPIVVYCRSGNRSATAVDMITRAGYSNVYDIQGGTNAWSSQGLPLQN